MITRENKETAKLVLSFYNMQACTGFRLFNSKGDDEVKINSVLDTIEHLGGVENTKAFIKEWVGNNPDEAKKGFYNWMRAAITGENKEDKKEEEKKVEEHTVASSLNILEQALIEVIKKQSVPQIEADIKSECTKMLQDFIKEEYGSIERKIVTVIDGKKSELKGVQHEKFETVLKFVANDEPVFLTGPAGSGKNFICKQVAEALGLKFYFTNAVTQEYKLTGFTDANGVYQETQFYKAFTQGGVFMLDEMDASIPEVLVILNAAIANRYFDFPAPIGYVEAHPDFRVIAAGNTTGHGADYEYVGRNQLDGASLDRFAIIRIDYSEAVENNMAGNDMELADFCREFRKATNKVGIQVIVSYRAINRLAKMTQILELDEALDTCLIKGLEKDDINVICNELQDSKYRTALRKLAA